MDERLESDEYERFAQWLLDAAQERLTPKRFDPFVLFEAWKAGIASERKRNADSAGESR